MSRIRIGLASATVVVFAIVVLATDTAYQALRPNNTTTTEWHVNSAYADPESIQTVLDVIVSEEVNTTDWVEMTQPTLYGVVAILGNTKVKLGSPTGLGIIVASRPGMYNFIIIPQVNQDDPEDRIYTPNSTETYTLSLSTVGGPQLLKLRYLSVRPITATGIGTPIWSGERDELGRIDGKYYLAVYREELSLNRPLGFLVTLEAEHAGPVLALNEHLSLTEIPAEQLVPYLPGEVDNASD